MSKEEVVSAVDETPPAARSSAPRADRSIALVVLASVAVILMLHWVRDVLVPIAAALFISYLLAPAVNWLRRRARIPSPIGAAITLAVALGAFGAGVIALEPQARKLLDTVPTAAKKLDRELRLSARDKESTVTKMKQAAAEIERAAATVTQTGPQAAGRPKASPDAPVAQGDRLFIVGTTTVLVTAANAIVVIALVYFLLVSGDALKRKLVRISGDTLRERRITVDILDEIDRQIQRYLMAHVGTSLLLGALSWIAFVLIGLDNAMFWAVAAAALHLVPYVGSALTMALTGLVAYLQFDGPGHVAAVIGSQIVIACLVGLVMMPWLSEKMVRINAVSIFIALLFWGWLWGVWGLLLCVPIMVAIKAVCERVPELQPVAELLGRDPPRSKPAATGAAAGA